MIRITDADFKKFVALLAKEGQPGAVLSFEPSMTGGSLIIKTVDRNGKEMAIELSDTRNSMLPRITRTETF